MDPLDKRHATTAGWQKHIRDKETPCQPCAEARRTYQRRQPHIRALGAKPYVRIGARAYANVLELRYLTDREWRDHTGTSKEVRNRILNGDEGRHYQALPHVAQKLRDLDPAAIRDRLLTHIGAVRRVQALARIGYSGAAIAREAGMHEDAVVLLRSGRYTTSSQTTRRKIAAAYDRLHMTPVPRDRITARTLNAAERAGWPAPFMWDHIDNPAENPNRAKDGARAWDDFDPARVERILGGDWKLATGTRKAERIAVIERWRGTLNELERLTGWKIERDYRRGDVA